MTRQYIVAFFLIVKVFSFKPKICANLKGKFLFGNGCNKILKVERFKIGDVLEMVFLEFDGCRFGKICGSGPEIISEERIRMLNQF